MRAESSREALKIARELHDTAIEVALPTVDNSLAAIAAARDAAAAEEDEQDGGVPDDSGQDDDAPVTQSPAVAPAGAV